MTYNKLVRDKVPQLIKKAGKKPITETLSDNAFIYYLERKLDEEVQEYHESQKVEELVDILEVVQSLAEARGVKYVELLDMKVKKAVKNGRFSKKTFLLSVKEKPEGWEK